MRAAQLQAAIDAERLAAAEREQLAAEREEALQAIAEDVRQRRGLSFGRAFLRSWRATTAIRQKTRKHLRVLEQKVVHRTRKHQRLKAALALKT